MIAPPPYSPHPSGLQVIQPNTVAPATSPRYEESPPSYESLFGRVKAVEEKSSSKWDFCRNLCNIVFTSVFCGIVLIVLSAIPISELVVGAIYANDCPFHKYIPIYLIVSGVTWIIKFVSIAVQILRKRPNENEEQNREPNGCSTLFNIFLFVWFILGNRWVFGISPEWVPDPMSSFYCHTTVYYFAYWKLISFYILIGFLCVVTTVLGFIYQHCSSSS